MQLSYIVMQLLGTAQGSTAASIATSSIKRFYMSANRANMTYLTRDERWFGDPVWSEQHVHAEYKVSQRYTSMCQLSTKSTRSVIFKLQSRPTIEYDKSNHTNAAPSYTDQSCAALIDATKLSCP